MSRDRTGSERNGESAVRRRERLAAELRSNLLKRKAQARSKARRDEAQEENAATLLPSSTHEKS